VGVALQIQCPKVLKRDRGGRRVKLAVFPVAPKCLGNLDVREVRHVQAEGWVSNPRRNRQPGRRIEQQLNESRGVEDNHRDDRKY